MMSFSEFVSINEVSNIFKGSFGKTAHRNIIQGLKWNNIGEDSKQVNLGVMDSSKLTSINSAVNKEVRLAEEEFDEHKILIAMLDPDDKELVAYFYRGLKDKKLTGLISNDANKAHGQFSVYKGHTIQNISDNLVKRGFDKVEVIIVGIDKNRVQKRKERAILQSVKDKNFANKLFGSEGQPKFSREKIIKVLSAKYKESEKTISDLLSSNQEFYTMTEFKRMIDKLKGKIEF